MEFTIDKHIPVPAHLLPQPAAKPSSKYGWGEMKIGDSFLVENMTTENERTKYFNNGKHWCQLNEPDAKIISAKEGNGFRFAKVHINDTNMPERPEVMGKIPQGSYLDIYKWDEMEVGESFFVPDCDESKRNSIWISSHAWFRKHKIECKLITKNVDGGFKFTKAKKIKISNFEIAVQKAIDYTESKTK